MLGLAMIMSIPGREHNTSISASDKKLLEDALKKAEKFTSEDDTKEEKKDTDKPKKDTEKPKKDTDKPKEAHSEPIMKKSPRIITDAEKSDKTDTKKEEDEPSPVSSVSKLVSSSESSGSEKFSLMNASPF